MADFRAVTEEFAVSGQISPGDVAAAAAQGFTLIVNNRPDEEAPGQPSGASIQAAAAAAGLSYLHVPVVGRASPGEVAAMTRRSPPAARPSPSAAPARARS